MRLFPRTALIVGLSVLAGALLVDQQAGNATMFGPERLQLLEHFIIREAAGTREDNFLCPREQFG